MRPGFMTSVCPGQTLPELIATAARYGYEGIEFRVEWDHKHGVELDAPAGAIREAHQALAEAGVAASCVATSVKFNSADRAEHLPQRETLRRYVELAAELGAPCLRTFSDSVPEDDEAAREHVLALAAESYAAVDDWAGQHGVAVLVETHTNMRAHWAMRILEQAHAKSLGVLWHPAHHLQRGQSMDEAYGHLKGHVRHLHFGAPPVAKHVTDADNQRSFDLLAADGFAGFFSVELINPDDSDAVLAKMMEKFKQYAAATP